MSTMPAYAYALTVFPSSDIGAEGINPARDFMARHARILNARPKALFDEYITVADAARLHPHANLSNIGLQDLTFY
jgi:hypothetical protein